MNAKFLKEQSRVVRLSSREKDIFLGKCDTLPSKKEIELVAKKASALGFVDAEERLFIMYESVFVPNKEDPRTIEELRAELQSLTPWPIQWEHNEAEDLN